MFEGDLRVISDPVLRARCSEIHNFDKSLKDLGLGLLRMLQANPHGIGLAANQVGLTLRMFVYEEGLLQKPAGVLCNPVVWQSSGAQLDSEGCLSIPRIFRPLERANQIMVSGKDLDGVEMTFAVQGLAARLVQHEVDHLNGILFADRLPRRERASLYRELEIRSE